MTKTPKQLANEKAMEILNGINEPLTASIYIKLKREISTHLLPLYECVEALQLVNDTPNIIKILSANTTIKVGYALNNLPTPTTEKKKGVI